MIAIEVIIYIVIWDLQSLSANGIVGNIYFDTFFWMDLNNTCVT